MDELQTLEQLLNELLQGIQDVIQSGEVLTDDFQLLLAQELEYLTTRIDELKSQNPVEGLQPNTQAPELQPGPFPSSNINSFKYDPKNERLFVKFHGKDNADSGPVYGYQGVPEFIFDVFRRGAVAPKTSGKNKYHQWFKGVTPSLGASMNALIKAGGYAYNRIS